MKGRLLSIMNCTGTNRFVLIVCTTLLLAFVTAFSLVSCGRDSEPEDTGTNHAEGTGPRPGDTDTGDAGSADPFVVLDLASAFNRDHFYGETLTISVSTDSSHMQALADAYMMRNPGVSVEVIPNYILNLRTANEVRWSVNNQLANGTAPILICARIIDHHNPISTRYLADWFPIMSTSPYFDEDDYFFNVFHAVTVDGRLYTFPTRFSYRMVVANSTVPGLVPLLGTYNDMYGGVTISQQMEMMRLMGSTMGHMYLDSYFDVFVGIWDYLYNFIDMNTRRVNFDNQRFIDFITRALEVTCPNTIYGQKRVSNHTPYARDNELKERYFFQQIGDTVFQYFVNFGEGFRGARFAFEAPTPITPNENDAMDSIGLFSATHGNHPQHDIVAPAPIVSSRGELIINTYDSFVLGAHATVVQQALALDFMEFMTSLAGNVAATRVTGAPPVQLIPVNRTLYTRTIVSALFNVISSRESILGPWIAIHGQVFGAQTNDIAGHLFAINNMPMISTQMSPEVTSIIFEVLENFHNGTVSAEETARNLQSRVAVALH